MVSVALPPIAMVAGAIVFASVGAFVVTAIGAEAGSALPPLVASAPVVLVTVPGVADVIATVIVQPPGGMVLPAAMVITFATSVTPRHVPLVPCIVLTPAGIGSRNDADSVSGVVFRLPRMSVSVAVPPTLIDDGAIDLASVGGAMVTVSGALAGGAVPASVTAWLVVLVTVPGVADVTWNTIVQPPTGIVLPAALVIVAAVLITPVHVPVLPPTSVTPPGIVSVNGADSVIGIALLLPSVMVSVALPAATMVDGRRVLVSAEFTAVTVSGACAAGAVPAEVARSLVVLVTVPVVADVTATTIVQPPGGIEVPAASVIELAATVTPVQEPVLPEVVVTPAGIGSVNGVDTVIATGFVLPAVIVSVALPPMPMVAGRMAFASVGSAFTVSGALAGGALPALEVSVPVVLVTVPGVLDVTVTTIVHEPTGIVLPVAMVRDVDATVTPVQVPVLPLAVVTPVGMLSTKSAASVIGTAFELDSVSVSVAVPPTAIGVGAIVFASVGATAVTVSGALAGGAVPVLVERPLVVLVTEPGVLDVTVTTIVQPPAGTVLPDAIAIAPAATVTPVQVPVLPLVVVTPAGMLSVSADDSVIATGFALPT